MQIRSSPNAAADLEEIIEYIARDNPIVAQRVGRTPPLPFIVIYRVLEHADTVQIVNVIHGAQRQRWPLVD